MSVLQEEQARNLLCISHSSVPLKAMSVLSPHPSACGPESLWPGSGRLSIVLPYEGDNR